MYEVWTESLFLLGTLGTVYDYFDYDGRYRSLFLLGTLGTIAEVSSKQLTMYCLYSS